MLVATPSGITLAPEGGAHQSIYTPLIGMGQPGLTVLRAGLRRRAGGDHALGPSSTCRQTTAARSTCASRPAACRAAASARCRREQQADIVAGGYWYARRRRRRARHRLHGRGHPRGDRGARRASSDDFAGAGLLARDLGRPPARRLARRPAQSRPTAGTAIARRRRSSACWRRSRATPRLVTVIDGHPLALSWLGSVRGQPRRAARRRAASASRATSPTSTAPTSSTRQQSSTRWPAPSGRKRARLSAAPRRGFVGQRTGEFPLTLRIEHGELQ